jgi:4'-phosphopantetheinyl transferase
MLSSDRVALVMAGSTEDVLAAIDGAEAMLTTVERSRADTFRLPSHQADFIAAHALGRVCAGHVLAASPAGLTLVQTCERCGGPHGRPILAQNPNVQVSLSHAAGYVAVVAGRGPVGLDAERYGREGAYAELGVDVLSPAEHAKLRTARDPRLVFLRQWVRKEAMVKLGLTSLDTMSSLDLSELPVDEPVSGSAIVARTWADWRLLEWTDSAAGVIGTAMARMPLLGPLSP